MKSVRTCQQRGHTRSLAVFWMGFLLLTLFNHLLLADIDVPDDYPTIQQAIDAAQPGETINIAAGEYNERLTIGKSLSLSGSGPASCFLYFTTQSPEEPLVTVTGPCDVEIRHMKLTGGDKHPSEPGIFDGTVPKGIEATNAVLTLDDLIINNINVLFVNAGNSDLSVTNVELQDSLNLMVGADVGFLLCACTATFTNLRQMGGRIDHTIDINVFTWEEALCSSGHSTVLVTGSTIRAIALYRGDCIRTYRDCDLTVTGCTFYREPGGDPPTSNNGVSVNGPGNLVRIIDNTFDGVPYAVSFLYSPYAYNTTQVIVQGNRIQNSEISGVRISEMDYEGIDLGGGSLGSSGCNVFSNSATYDIEMWEGSSADVFARYNAFSHPDPSDAIYDWYDDRLLGEVFYSPAGSIVYVDYSVQPGGTGFYVDPLSSLHEALGQMCIPGTIRMMPGSTVITEAIVIDVPVRLEKAQ